MANDRAAIVTVYPSGDVRVDGLDVGAPPTGGNPIVAQVISTPTTVLAKVAATVPVNIGIPSGLVPGDVLVALISTLGANTGTISPVIGPANWTSIHTAAHNTNYVWHLFQRVYTGLDPVNWDQFSDSETTVNGAFRGIIIPLRGVANPYGSRSAVTSDVAGNTNPLAAPSFTGTLPWPGDFLTFFVNSKNGAGSVPPPAGYTEILDVVDAGAGPLAGQSLWTYAAYKVAAGSENQAQVSIVPGSAADMNAVSAVAHKHAGGAA